MDKRYQVFISSTKEDLEDARAEVSQALLRANCFPAAMELFPAADEGIDDYIKQKIDESDYMILILAGRYGSVNPQTGISWTEEEYDYAVETGKPVVRLVHKNPFETLPGSKIEQDPERRAKLEAFREKVTSTRIARLWDSDRELGAEVVLGMLDVQKRHPAPGWVRFDHFLRDAEGDFQNSITLESLRGHSSTQPISAGQIKEILDEIENFSQLAVVRLKYFLNLSEESQSVGPFWDKVFWGQDLCIEILDAAYQQTNKDQFVNYEIISDQIRQKGQKIISYKDFIENNHDKFSKRLSIEFSLKNFLSKWTELDVYDHVDFIVGSVYSRESLRSIVPEESFRRFATDFDLEDNYSSGRSSVRSLEFLMSLGLIDVYGATGFVSVKTSFQITDIGKQVLLAHRTGHSFGVQ